MALPYCNMLWVTMTVLDYLRCGRRFKGSLFPLPLPQKLEVATVRCDLLLELPSFVLLDRSNARVDTQTVSAQFSRMRLACPLLQSKP